MNRPVVTTPALGGQSLRQKAEALASKSAPRSPEDFSTLSPEESRRLLEELHMHQVELEMQNEELQGTLTKLDVSQGRYFDFYDLAPVGYLTLDDKGLIVQANLTAAALMGVARDELLNQPMTRFVRSEDQDSYHLRRQKILATGVPQVCELCLVKQDGADFWVRLDAIAALDENRALVLRIVLHDMTEVKAVEAVLRRDHEMLERTEAIAKIGSWQWDVATGVVTWSAELFRIFQRNPADGALSLAEQSEIYDSDDMRRLTAAVDAAVSNGTPYGMELRARRQDGEVLVCRARGYAQRGSDKKVAYLYGSLQDITEESQREAQRLRDEAAQRDALMREVHHRTKNSLQGATGILRGLAQRHPMLVAEIDDIVSQISSIALVHGLYGSNSGRPVSLCDVLADFVRSAESVWQLEIAFARENDCLHFILDERESMPLALVLNELLANACKHTRGKLTFDKCRVAVNYAADFSQVWVRITNPGQLPPGFDFGKRQGLGTGLGLVAVLLPREGATLDWTQQGETVVTQLSLSPPIFTEVVGAEGSAA